ncbi:MAG: transcriptional regulator, LacI family protein [Rhodocyclales bacterium]|nr:transcriptional regulator, LacI family protein [Rhodocyclales bacterium]
MARSALRVGFVLFDPRFGAFIWTVGENCLRTEAMRRGIQFTTVQVLSVDEQAAELSKFVEKGVDAIVLKPMACQHPAIIAVLEQARAAHIPVVSLDSPVDGVRCTVGSDNAKGQAIVVEHVLARLGHRGKLAYFSGDERVPSGAMRTHSFHETLARYPDVVVAYEAMLDWTALINRREQGAKFAREALRQVPDLDAIISATDEGALGAAEVIQEMGLSARILIAGFDGIPEALLAVESGRMLATVRQLPRAIAARTLDIIEALIDGEDVPPLSYVDVELTTAEKVGSAALDSLELIPGLIVNIASNHEEQRKLQQTIITTQHNILQTVIAVSTAVGSIRDPDDMMHKVVDLLQDRFKLVCAKLYTLPDTHDGDGALTLRAYGGKNVNGICEIPLPALPAEGASEATLRVAAPAPDGELSALSELTIPLISSEHVIGVLELYGANEHAFDEDSVSVLNVIAHQVAVAIENANLYRETVYNARLQEENREKLMIAEKMASLGRLTAGIAHEMNTPLAAVRAAVSELASLVKEYNESIGDDSVNEDDHREIAAEMSKSLHLAESAAERASGFVRGVKSQTRDLSAQQLVSFNAVTVIRESILLLSHALREKRSTTNFEHEHDVMEILGSPSRLAQIITNLVTNAIDAMAERGGGKIDVRLKQQAGFLVLQVSDEGCGMPPEVQSKVFDPMFTTKPFGEGTGLGLTIVHDIVKGDFNGSIDIDSHVGVGTTFIIRLAKGQ